MTCKYLNGLAIANQRSTESRSKFMILQIQNKKLAKPINSLKEVPKRKWPLITVSKEAGITVKETKRSANARFNTNQFDSLRRSSFVSKITNMTSKFPDSANKLMKMRANDDKTSSVRVQFFVIIPH